MIWISIKEDTTSPQEKGFNPVSSLDKTLSLLNCVLGTLT